MDEPVSTTEHYIYLLNYENTLTQSRMVKYNVRAALTPNSANGATGAYSLRTSPVTLVGTPSQTNNGRLFTVQHGWHGTDLGSQYGLIAEIMRVRNEQKVAA